MSTIGAHRAWLGVTRYGQKESVHVAVRSWISTGDNSSIDDVLPRKMLPQSGLGILARRIGNLWDRHHRQFECAPLPKKK